ncbi:hypothetical protein HDE74_004236 [Janthinobacterium sp. K2Li3]|nr:hypothetical protein [Janthinobacterium sp. K2C7]MBB5383465.1 hypothetical protein [Janthinobacterium sp. K2Li3]MBB5388919.1 hypothetical protein [Janthinobacterium sp. K2E3]
MKTTLTASITATLFALCCSTAMAADAPKAANSQQSKMAACNADASGKKGDERKAFMKECLSAKPAPAVAMTQQDKMKACNTDAAGKKGDERKAFMKTCLSAPKK